MLFSSKQLYWRSSSVGLFLCSCFKCIFKQEILKTEQGWWGISEKCTDASTKEPGEWSLVSAHCPGWTLLSVLSSVLLMLSRLQLPFLLPEMVFEPGALHMLLANATSLSFTPNWTFLYLCIVISRTCLIGKSKLNVVVPSNIYNITMTAPL